MIDIERVMALRLAIGRMGEADMLNWWPSRQMGPAAAAALRRNFTRTYDLAAARTTMLVASETCDQRTADQQAISLWKLTDECEDAIDRGWAALVDRRDSWTELFTFLRSIGSDARVCDVLRERGLITTGDVVSAERLRKVPNVDAIDAGSHETLTEDVIGVLAAAFLHSSRDRLLLPTARLAPRG